MPFLVQAADRAEQRFHVPARHVRHQVTHQTWKMMAVERIQQPMNHVVYAIVGGIRIVRLDEGFQLDSH